MSNAHLLNEDPKWWEVLALPQVEQDDVKWQYIRKNKQSGSDFASCVPYTKKFIGHIISRWNYPEPKYDESKVCDGLYEDFIRKKGYPYPRDAEGNIIPDPNDNKTGNKGTSTLSAMGIGNRYENIVQNLCSQLCQAFISQIGWIEEMRTSCGGVSGDGLLHSTVSHDSKRLINYFISDQSKSRFLDENEIGYLSPGTKNFEAKTVVSREMCKRIPLKYHIQVERTAYELHLKSSVYAEAQFLELCEHDWMEQIKSVENEGNMRLENYSKFGILIVSTNKITGESIHIWPHVFVRTPQHFMKWRDQTMEKMSIETPNNQLDSIYFRLESMWIVEVPLWQDYESVYGPLIKKEADYIHYLVHTPEGRKEYQDKWSEKVAKRVVKPRAKPICLFKEDMSRKL